MYVRGAPIFWYYNEDRKVFDVDTKNHRYSNTLYRLIKNNCDPPEHWDWPAFIEQKRSNLNGGFRVQGQQVDDDWAIRKLTPSAH